MIDHQRILVLAPHTDDGEFGCGGSIARWLEEGREVIYAAFSVCEESVPEGWPADTLEREVREATASLGIRKDNLLLFGYRVRRFDASRQDILEDLVRLNRELQPGLVLTPSLNDIHQDHATVSREAVRAFKRTSILGYEMPWNNLTINTSGFVKLQERHLDAKLRALRCYASQRNRGYAKEDVIRSLATVRGAQIGCDLAETFEIVRWVL